MLRNISSSKCSSSTQITLSSQWHMVLLAAIIVTTKFLSSSKSTGLSKAACRGRLQTSHSLPVLERTLLIFRTKILCSP